MHNERIYPAKTTTLKYSSHLPKHSNDHVQLSVTITAKESVMTPKAHKTSETKNSLIYPLSILICQQKTSQYTYLASSNKGVEDHFVVRDVVTALECPLTSEELKQMPRTAISIPIL